MKKESKQTKSPRPSQTDWVTIKIEGEEEAAFLPASHPQPADAHNRTGGLGTFVRVEGEESSAIDESK